MRTVIHPRARILAVGAGVAALLATAALAHTQRGAPPDMLRLQGYRAAAPAGGNAQELRLTVNGREERFYATELRHFSLVDPRQASEPDTTAPFFLQATPETLSRFSAARPEQRITILAEWRPGRRDLFVLAMDLCPER
jgi:hypothetical protein